MPGTRTAPTIDGSVTYKIITVTWFDYTADQRSDSYQVDADVTNLEIEAFVAALQASSNATLWRVAVQEVYNSVGDASNALEEVWEEASQNLVIQTKNTANDSRRVFVPAPINAMFIEGTEQIDPTNATLTTLISAYLPLVTGFSAVGARMTSRRQINAQTKF